MGVYMGVRMGVYIGVRIGDRADVRRAVCRAVYVDDYRASIELYISIQTFVRAINRRDVYRDDRIGNCIDV
jgi:hypothetical protein